MEWTHRHRLATTKIGVDSLVARLPESERIPKKRGDLAFDKPWEIRALSMTVALHDEGAFAWTEFQQGLVGSIKSWEQASPDLEGWSYYERWLEAFETIAVEHDWLTRAELDGRTAELLCRPTTQDHHHATRVPVTPENYHG